MRPEPDDSPGCGVTEKDGESNCSARHAIPDMNPAEKGPSVKSRLNVTSFLSDSLRMYGYSRATRARKHKYQLT